MHFGALTQRQSCVVQFEVHIWSEFPCCWVGNNGVADDQLQVKGICEVRKQTNKQTNTEQTVKNNTRHACACFHCSTLLNDDESCGTQNALCYHAPHWICVRIDCTEFNFRVIVNCCVHKGDWRVRPTFAKCKIIFQIFYNDVGGISFCGVVLSNSEWVLLSLRVHNSNQGLMSLNSSTCTMQSEKILKKKIPTWLLVLHFEVDENMLKQLSSDGIIKFVRVLKKSDQQLLEFTLIYLYFGLLALLYINCIARITE